MLRTFTWLLFMMTLLTACAAKQTATQFQGPKPAVICIAEHEAVLREGFREALVQAFHSHGARTKIIRGVYVEKDSAWNPSIYPEDTKGCDAIAFYVANWAWDLSMYMYFASIWITDVEMTKKIAQATYQTGGGLDKFINARDKVFELVDEIYGSTGRKD